MHVGTKPGTERPRISLKYKSIFILRLIFLIPAMSIPCLTSQPLPAQPRSFAPNPQVKKHLLLPSFPEFAPSRSRGYFPKVTEKTRLSPPSTPSNKERSGLSFKSLEPSSPS